MRGKRKTKVTLVSPLQSSTPLLARAVTPWSAAAGGASSGPPSTATASSGVAELLSFSQGDVIDVLQQADDWWLGQLSGTQGWFPRECVTVETSGSLE